MQSLSRRAHLDAHMERTRVVIIGAGFAGLAAAQTLGSQPGIEVTVLDRRNYHLFQPLLYQVATAGLNPADIASPIRSILNQHENIYVAQAEVTRIDRARKLVCSSAGEFEYDRLIVATGSEHHYFGQDAWEPHAPGLKTLEGATEIRRRILSAFERAEVCKNKADRSALLRFIVVGGGPTGVELAGAIAEMARMTLADDFRRVDARTAQVVILEAGPRLLAAFEPGASSRAQRDLEQLGVRVQLGALVTQVDEEGVCIGQDRLESRTVIWAAGVQASELGETLQEAAKTHTAQGRVQVSTTLRLPEDPSVYVIGDVAGAKGEDGRFLPAMAPVASQQGRYAARHILGRETGDFVFRDKGIMATIGRNRAIAQRGRIKLYGYPAWIAWLVVHIFFLIGFRNRVAVLFQWASSYLTYAKHARLIATRDWKRPLRGQRAMKPKASKT